MGFSTNKYKALHFQNQTDYGAEEQARKYIEWAQVKGYRWACILHDKDVKDDGKTPKPNHIHVVVEFGKGDGAPLDEITPQTIENATGIESKFFQSIGGKGMKIQYSIENAYAYLTHITAKAKADGKYQYQWESVEANFDYVAFAQKYADESKKIVEKKNVSARKAEIAEKIINCEVRICDFQNHFTNYERTAYRTWIDNAIKTRNENLNSQLAEPGDLESIYIYGPAGVGKTTMADTVMRSKGINYYDAQGSRDPFEFYADNSGIVYNDYADNVMTYRDFLQFTEPKTKYKKLNARFHNKIIMPETLIITSDKKITDLYSEALTDNREQIYRRFPLYIEMDIDTITYYIYNNQTRRYEFDRREDNPYTKIKWEKESTSKLVDVKTIQAAVYAVRKAADEEDEQNIEKLTAAIKKYHDEAISHNATLCDNERILTIDEIKEVDNRWAGSIDNYIEYLRQKEEKEKEEEKRREEQKEDAFEEDEEEIKEEKKTVIINTNTITGITEDGIDTDLLPF